jgi:hypothetical protein
VYAKRVAGARGLKLRVVHRIQNRARHVQILRRGDGERGQKESIASDPIHEQDDDFLDGGVDLQQTHMRDARHALNASHARLGVPTSGRRVRDQAQLETIRSASCQHPC